METEENNEPRREVEESNGESPDQETQAETPDGFLQSFRDYITPKYTSYQSGKAYQTFLGQYGASRISVIIPCISDSVFLRRTIWSLVNTIDWPIELIVRIDPDKTYSENINEGLDLATSNLIVICHDDVMFPAAWLLKMAMAYANVEDMGVIFPKTTGFNFEETNYTSTIQDFKTFFYPYKHLQLIGGVYLYDKQRIWPDVTNRIHSQQYKVASCADLDFGWAINEYGLKTVLDIGTWVLHWNQKKKVSRKSLTEDVDLLKASWPTLMKDQRCDLWLDAWSKKITTDHNLPLT